MCGAARRGYSAGNTAASASGDMEERLDHAKALIFAILPSLLEKDAPNLDVLPISTFAYI